MALLNAFKPKSAAPRFDTKIADALAEVEPKKAAQKKSEKVQLTGRPRAPKGKQEATESITIRVHPEVRTEIGRIAEALNMTVTNLILSAIEDKRKRARL